MTFATKIDAYTWAMTFVNAGPFIITQERATGLFVVRWISFGPTKGAM